MIGKNGRDPVRLIQQGVNISVGGVPDVQPCGVVVAQQRRPAFLRGAMPTDIPVQGEPPRQKIAAQRHVLLTIALDLRIGAFEANVRVCEAALHKVRLRPHDLLRALPMALGDLIIVGHTLVHFGQLALQLPPLPGRTSSGPRGSRRSSLRFFGY